MSYSLHEFCAEVRATLAVSDDRTGREAIRQKLELLLQDAAFCSTYIKASDDSGVTQIYQDPEFKFCILTYNMTEPRTSPPHDHGNSWAIYGQAVGETEMTDWKIVTPPNGDIPGKVKMVRSYRLRPGDAYLYERGDVHAPMREGPTRLIRIEGQNTEKVTRTPLEAI